MRPRLFEMLKRLVPWLAVGVAAAPVSLAQTKAPQAQSPVRGLPTPTHGNVAYGPHERNVLDFWQSKAAAPAPLVMFIHGGGFTGGDKGQIGRTHLQGLLDAGISVAAIQYRFLKHAPLPAAHQDAARALQFLRFKAQDWNVDKKRIGAFGGSAGAQLCVTALRRQDQDRGGQNHRRDSGPVAHQQGRPADPDELRDGPGRGPARQGRQGAHLETPPRRSRNQTEAALRRARCRSASESPWRTGALQRSR